MGDSYNIRLYSGFSPSQNFYNFGDALGFNLITKLSNHTVELVPFWKANVLGPGSILFDGGTLFLSPASYSISGLVRAVRERLRKIIYPSVKIWGAGFIRPPERMDGDFSKRFEVCAVRGRRTLEFLERMNIVEDNTTVALGDPGLLYPMLLEEMPAKEFEIGVVPHYVDKVAGRNLHEKLLAVGIKSVLIDVNGKDSVGVLSKIASCQTILSSSLHGCIVSDAMGIPNRLIQLSMISAKPSPSFLDYAFKFIDYYSAYGITEIKPMQINEFYEYTKDIVKRISETYIIDAEKVASIKRSLLASFPFGECD